MKGKVLLNISKLTPIDLIRPHLTAKALNLSLKSKPGPQNVIGGAAVLRTSQNRRQSYVTLKCKGIELPLVILLVFIRGR